MKIDPPVKYSFFFDFPAPSGVPGAGKDCGAEKFAGQPRFNAFSRPGAKKRGFPGRKGNPPTTFFPNGVHVCKLK